jgi:hypothetical protein
VTKVHLVCLPLLTLAATALALGSFPRAQEPSPADLSPPTPDHALVDRFLSRTDQPLIASSGVRRMEARNERFHVEGWLEARTVLRHGVFAWTIEREGGSTFIRNRVLRAALRGEAELIALGEPARATLSAANYEWGPVSPAGINLATLEIRPRRRDVLLVDGTITVSAPDADLLRVEGWLAKGPSFWTPRVHIVREYARIAGVRVPMSLESTSLVRFVGASHLRVTYSYDMVNDHPVVEAEAAAR